MRQRERAGSVRCTAAKVSKPPRGLVRPRIADRRHADRRCVGPARPRRNRALERSDVLRALQRRRDQLRAFGSKPRTLAPLAICWRTAAAITPALAFEVSLVHRRTIEVGNVVDGQRDEAYESVPFAARVHDATDIGRCFELEEPVSGSPANRGREIVNETGRSARRPDRDPVVPRSSNPPTGAA